VGVEIVDREAARPGGLVTLRWVVLPGREDPQGLAQRVDIGKTRVGRLRMMIISYAV